PSEQLALAGGLGRAALSCATARVAKSKRHMVVAMLRIFISLSFERIGLKALNLIWQLHASWSFAGSLCKLINEN
ncbi:MAG: hypothetical protein ABLQ96_02895, partial [Candidatus Acidiferrum sp.]